MVEGILNGVPLWVWPLFVVLLLFGLRATKQRRVPVWVSYLLPLMGLLSINTAAQTGNTSLVWGMFCAGYIAGTALGYVLQRRWIILKEEGRITLAGEWVTLITMMTIFLANFVAGTLKAINPELYQSNGFIVVFVFLIACASGVFFGRAVRVFRS